MFSVSPTAIPPLHDWASPIGQSGAAPEGAGGAPMSTMSITAIPAGAAGRVICETVGAALGSVEQPDKASTRKAARQRGSGSRIAQLLPGRPRRAIPLLGED